MIPAGGGKGGLWVGREAWNGWLKSASLVSVGGSDIGVSFEKYSLELFVEVGVGWGRGGGGSLHS